MTTWLVILVALAPAYLIRFEIVGIPTTLFELLIYGTVLASFRGMGKWPRSVVLGILLVALGVLVGIGQSHDLRGALGIAKGFILDPILFALLVVVWFTPKTLPKLLVGYVLGVALVSLVSLIGAWLGASWATAWDGRLLGIYGLEAGASPNYLAMWVAPAVALLAVWLSQPRAPLRASHWFLGGSLVLCLAALLLTGSRAGIGAAALGWLAGLAFLYRTSFLQPRVRWLAGITLICIVVGGWLVLKPNYALSPEEGGRITSSNNIRWDIWRTTVELMTTPPTRLILGVGLGSYQHQFYQLTNGRVNYNEFITPRALTPHNVLLNVWVNLGLFGLAGVLLLIWFVAHTLLGARSDPLTTGLVALGTTILIHGVADTTGWKNDLSILPWLVLAAAVVLRSMKGSPR